MSLVPNRAIEGAAGNQGYNLQRSLRFRSSASAYLSRTPASATNQQKWTWSGWAKVGALGGGTFFAARTGVSATYTTFNFFGNNQLVFQDNNITALQTAAVFRDTSAWYHFVCSVDTTQATAANRIQMYVNGVLQSISTGTYPTQNTNLNVNSTATHLIGQQASGSYFDGYLAEVNFIDGQALTPSSFGQTDPVTGVWTPKKYTGTYGTNGFYLPFSDNTSATTLAYDKSGNGNNWTPNNISTTAGATYDSMTDVPTLTSATAANYCVLNPLDNSVLSISSGNLNATSSTAAWNSNRSTIGISSGKWYWEYQTSYNNSAMVGIETQSASLTTYVGNNATGYAYNSNDGKKYNNGVSAAYGATFTSGDIIGVAFDADAGTLTFYKNNTSQGTAYSSIPVGTYFPAISIYAGDSQTVVNYINFGQRPFSYTPPTGFKALNTFNLPDPTIKKPNQYMDASLYAGTSTTATATNGGFQPDLVWIKDRSQVASHVLTDSVRGASAQLFSNLTNAEQSNSAYVTAFNSNGFTVGVGNTGTGVVNNSGDNFVGWQWKKGATPGFDIVTYTGTGVARTVSHNLGVAPKMIICKWRSGGTTQGWPVYHASTGNTNYLALNLTDASSANSTIWNNTSPTSTDFTVGTNTWVNGNGWTYVAYLFAEIAGFSKFGSYTGNGSADGPFVYCGFRPKYILQKRSDAGLVDWQVKDVSRDPYNAATKRLWPNLSDAEGSGTDLDILSNGFKIRESGAATNTSGGTYIYAAFAENPFKYSLAR